MATSNTRKSSSAKTTTKTTITNAQDIESITKENNELKVQMSQMQEQMNTLLQKFAMLNLSGQNLIGMTSNCKNRPIT